MKLLITVQKIDIDDPILGFFHRWIEKFSEHYQKITVICLEKGECNLPSNVRVLSLGKELRERTDLGNSKRSVLGGQLQKIKYIARFYHLIWRERKNYDAVFVHMNQEYILLGGKLWLLLGKKVFMWRNHHAGNFLTDIASLFCSKVFCTSRYSYTAKYKKTVLVPVGVDTEKFKVQNEKCKVANSILFLGRIAPSKNVDIFIEALGLLKKRGVNFTASIYGDALSKDAGYFEKLKLKARELGLDDILKFHAGVPNHETPTIYNAHEIYVNLSSSGMYDKTIFEAMACGCLVLASNVNLQGQIDGRLIINERKAEVVAEYLARAMFCPGEEKIKMIKQGMVFAKTHSLKALLAKLYSAISS